MAAQPELNTFPSATDDVDRRHSIDHALELEHQLNNESQPPTPAAATTTHPDTAAPAAPSGNRPQSLDTHVLVSIVSQLREELKDVTKERDDLAALVAGSHSREANLQDAMQLLADKCTSMEEQLQAAQAKIRDDEDAISMLRNKVEESRRGLMRLQTENRRMSSQSSMSIDVGRAGTFATGPSSSKRASFTPLTGSGMSGHRRITSVNDASPGLGFSTSDSDFPASPSAQTWTFPRTPSPNASASMTPSATTPTRPPPSATRRFSGIFARPSMLELAPPDPVEALRRELQAARAELADTRHELTEANEAREASETCVKALREFIGENSIGVGGEVSMSASVGSDGASESIKLPPPPSETTGEEDEPRSRRPSTGSSWGFNKLWKADNITNHAHVHTSPPPAPLSRKFNGFFSSRASVSSTASSNASDRLNVQQPAFTGGSDTSSIGGESAEPISPENSPPRNSVTIRTSNRGSSSSDLGEAQPIHDKAQPLRA